MKNVLLTGILIVSLLTIIFGFKRSKSMVHTVDIGVVVTDLEKSLEFYTHILGMEQTGTWRSSREMSTKYDVNSGKAFDIIDLKLDCDGYILKYKLNKTEGNIPKETVASGKEYYGFEKIGSRYLTINVESIDPFIKRMKENHIRYKLVTLPNGHRVVLLHDPDGALLELASD
ncbi:VOC family protein [Rhodocytophaga rosea]|uniref:VOC family protein n=1 Tax=Rhodocytophaga rosea TaxID=2704465 RepID=A0A6C0GH38_9BACT|nr:VOC family protein [Rhodocytophaga rosea]QHT67371.1 VOC family protein [Rhodocytophaga rosea]